jgi:DNA-binding NarL/FixJ family response regulator
MMEQIKIILVDDHQLIRDGIHALLNITPDVKVVGEAANGDELLILLEKVKPHIVIMDISLPGKSGIELTALLRQKYPEINVIILSMFTSEEFIFNALKAGARGYLPKNTSWFELSSAITKVYAGNEFFSEQISDAILKSFFRNARSGNDDMTKQYPCLSAREKEILKMIAEGSSNAQIAEKLFISAGTVGAHKSHIMQKLSLNTTADLIKFAIRNNLVYMAP